MPRVRKRARLLDVSHEQALFDARLDAIVEELSGDIVFIGRRLTLQTTPEPLLDGGLPAESAEGVYTPMRLRFARGTWIQRSGIFADLDALAPDADARRIFALQHAYEPSVGEYYWLTMGAAEPGVLMLRARACRLEEPGGEPTATQIVRRWAPAPPPPPSIIPHRPVLHRRYGGDPIRIRLGGRWLRHRLFIGGLYHQRDERPAADHVLNLCGVLNPWCERHGYHPDDRYAYRGEMGAGMQLDDLLTEAAWVADRLRAGRRVLVHCYAGVNRSSTVCCAALMLLEGIGPEEALARVRELHPVAWPDPYYWFLLRWLARPPLQSTAPGASAEAGANGYAAVASNPALAPAAVLRQEHPIR
ncbi:MAG TPA: dual specificity protein phosphatase [Ktedonobacterales bacterium]|nr:dual specificity protein phosphatase [Ktedonobacterales bacterium]